MSYYVVQLNKNKTLTCHREFDLYSEAKRYYMNLYYKQKYQVTQNNQRNFACCVHKKGDVLFYLQVASENEFLKLKKTEYCLKRMNKEK